MIQLVFSIYDSKAKAFLPPFFMPRAEMAQRAFSECANSDDHQFGKHPADYTLFHLGNWDDDTGVFAEKTTPTSMGLALEYVKALESDDLSKSDNSNGADIRQIQIPHLQSSTESTDSEE